MSFLPFSDLMQHLDKSVLLQKTEGFFLKSEIP